MSQDSTSEERESSSRTSTTEVEDPAAAPAAANNLLQVLVQNSPFCGQCHTESMRREEGNLMTRSILQVDRSTSPSLSPAGNRPRTYELEVRNLSYKVVPGLRFRVLGRDLAAPLKKRRYFCSSAAAAAAPDPWEAAAANSYILKNVSCIAKPGELLAIAGPSGAGKSTLLEILSGKIRPSNRQKDTILVNQKPMDPNHFRRISGFVMQHDALFPLLTVFETLMFSAHLRLPSTMPAADKRKRVESLMAELGLLGVASSRIGGGDQQSVRGISGGERRRVSIGVDVIHNPAVLLLDEPTSGLDSAGALQVVGMLHNMAQYHERTIILSIHQPSFRILQLIHSILLLANGTVVHSGPLDLLAERLTSNGHRIPPQVNVVEYAIETIDLLEAQKSGRLVVSINEEVARIHSSLKELFDRQLKESADLLTSELEHSSSPDNSTAAATGAGGAADDKPMFANSRAREILVLSRRFGKIILRTKQLSAARTAQALFAGIGLGSIFYNLGRDDKGVQGRYGFFAFTLTFLLSSTTEALPLFLEERQIFMRETSRGAYRVSSYVIANALMFIPFLFVFAVLYSIPTYWLVGLHPGLEASLFFLLVVWLVVMVANSFVAFFSALVPNYILGNTLISGVVGAFFLFSGYFITKNHIPKYWLFMHYLSLFKYPLDALLINEYSPVADKCFGRSIGRVCTLTGRNILGQSGLENANKWNDVIIMTSFFFVYRVLCYIVLRYRHAHRQ